jgi:hypothetical protein
MPASTSWSRDKQAAFKGYVGPETSLQRLACPCLTCTMLRETFEKWWAERGRRAR